MLTVYDKGARPVALYKKVDVGLNVSYIVFENLSGNPTSQGVAMMLSLRLSRTRGSWYPKRVDGEVKNANGELLATTSYLIDMNLPAATINTIYSASLGIPRHVLRFIFQG